MKFCIHISFIIDRINQLDYVEQGQGLLSVIGKSRSMFYGERTGGVFWADIDEHPTAQVPRAYGLDKVFQVFGHTRLDGKRKDMIASDHFAMIDSQKCFITQLSEVHGMVKAECWVTHG